MAFGRLDIVMGANVKGLESAAGNVATITKRIEDRFAATAAKTDKIARGISNASNKIGQFSNDVSTFVDKIDLSSIPVQSQGIVKGIGEITGKVGLLSDVVTTASQAWSTLTAVAGAGLTKIAALIPRTGAAIAAMAGPIGIVVGLLVAGAAVIALNWDKLGNTLSDVQQIELQAAQSITAQEQKVRQLTATLTDNTASLRDRESALKTLQSISPTYFGQLDLEKSKINDVSAAYTKYIGNLEIAAKARLIDVQVNEKIDNVVDLKNKVKEIASKGAGIGEYIPLPANISLLINDTFIGNQSKVNDAIKKEEESIKSLLEERKKLNFTTDTPADKVTKTDKVKTGAKERDVLNEIAISTRKLIDEQKNLEGSGLINTLQAQTAEVEIYKRALQSISQLGLDNKGVLGVFTEFRKGRDEILSGGISSIVPRLDTKPFDTDKKRIEDAKKQMGDPVKIPLSIEDDGFNSKINNILTTLSTLGQVGDIFRQFKSNSLQERGAEIDAYYEKERSAIEKSILPHSIKAQKLKALEEKANSDRKKIQREQAVASRNQAIFSAIVNTAEAVTRAYAKGGIALGAIVGALGLAQVAAIASAPLPKLASGGIAYGNSIVNVGEYPGASANPEVIAPLSKLKDIISGVLINTPDGQGTGQSVVLQSIVKGDDLYLIGQLQDYKTTRVR